ncbi:MAG: BON domain-containing protein [Oligoflexia bacterium]|nr:BON domain-containing protein [Oligoflexia bacterium]
MNTISRISLSCFLVCCCSGCWVAAAGVGAEAGYVATQDDRTTKETLNDQFLVSAVKTKLIATKKVPALDVNVDAFKGTITLRGALRSEEQVQLALDAARSVGGVKAVESKLVVVQ